MLSNQHRHWLALFLIFALGLPACSRQAAPLTPGDKVLVAASILPLADFSRQVGGERVQVESLVPPGASPHTYELTPAQLQSISRAKVLVLNGVELEFWADKVIAAAGNPDLVVVRTAEGLDIIAGDEHEPGGNPHVWLSPLNAMHQVEVIRDALIQADPAGAAWWRAKPRSKKTRQWAFSLPRPWRWGFCSSG